MLPFFLLTVSFDFQKLLSFMRSHLLIDVLASCAIAVPFSNLSPVPMSTVCLVLCWALWSVELEFNAGWYILINLHSSTCWYPGRAAIFFKDSLFFPLCTSGFFSKSHMSIGIQINVWIFDSIALVNLSIFKPISYISFIIIVLYYTLKSGMIIPPEVLL